MRNWRQNTTGSKKRGIFSNAAAATSGQSITERFKSVSGWRWRSQHRNAKKQMRRNIQSDGIDDSMPAAMPKHESFQIYAAISFMGSNPCIFHVATHVKRYPSHSMVSSDLMEPRILRCTTISRSPRSAALLVGGIRGSKMNRNRSSYALPSLVRNFCRSSQSVRILRIPRMRLRKYLYSLRRDSNVSWASVPRLYTLEMTCSICFAS